MKKVLVTALLLAIAIPARGETPPEPRQGATHAVPLFGSVVHVYDAPENPYAAGHRGVDVSAPIGSPVRASAPGVVSFAGTVAGDTSVTIDHDPHLKTTYSFLGSIAVKKGDKVEAGTIVGTVGRGHPNSNLPPHVHLSARRDGVYFDPLEIYVGTRLDDLIDLTA